MLNVDVGIQGAKAIANSPMKTRAIVKRLMEENPNTTKDAIVGLYIEEMMVDKAKGISEEVREHWRNMAVYFASNSYQYLLPRPQRDYKAENERLKRKLREGTMQVLLDLMLPNGKPLAYATKKDLKKAGGWYLSIAERLGPGQKVGDVLTEKELRDIFEGRHN